MRTDLTALVGCEFPLFAFSHCRDVVAAVTKAGGVGVLGAVGHTPEQLEVDLNWIEGEVGNRPYGVDLIIPATYAGDDRGGLDLGDLDALIPAEHREFVAELMARYQVPDLPPDTGEGNAARREAPFSANQATLQLDIALAHRAALVANALGPPPPFMIDRVKAEGRLVAALAGSAVHAERHARAGADIVVAQGYEAGGHTGEIASMVLIPEVVDAVAPLPVLGAGGIGRGRQMAAAMALGAQGVWCGSVWLTTTEAETHPTVKAKMLSATSADTLRSRSLTGKPARMLRTAWSEEWDRPDAPEPLGMPLQSLLTATAQRRIDRAASNSDAEAARLAGYFVGQIVGNMTTTRSSAQVVYEMIDEFIESVELLRAQLGD